MKIKKNYCNRNIIIVMIAMLTAFISLTICTKSSFLYPMNDWVDSNCFLTMGKAIMNGKIMYKDIYEQKGPWLYFVHAIASVISPNSFLGVYVIEIVAFGIFIYIAYKCATMYIGNSKIGIILMPILAFIIPISKAFAHGDSVEELSLSFLMYSLYSVLRARHENRLLNKRECFINGICVAWALWTKFIICGFYIGLILYVFVWYCSTREWEKLKNLIVYFLFGFFLATAPVVLYFVTTGSLKYLLQVYFYNNMFLYQVNSQVRKIDRVINFINSCINMVRTNIPYTIFMIVGIVDMYIRKTKGYMAVLMSFCALLISTYGKGSAYIYYGLIFSVYSFLGVCVLMRELIKWRKIDKIKTVTFSKLLIGFYIISILTELVFSGNTYLMKYSKNDMPQYKFAQKINQVKDAKILNYHFLDGGFYLASGCLPVNRFFCGLNIPLEEMYEDQNQCIEKKEVDFVVTRDTKLEDYGLDASAYRCIDIATMPFEGADRTYYLYELEDN